MYKISLINFVPDLFCMNVIGIAALIEHLTSRPKSVFAGQKRSTPRIRSLPTIS